MNIERIKNSVEKHRELILAAERYIWANPETGYKEFKTTAYLKEKYEALGYKLDCPEDITGFVTEIDTGRPGPTLLILGELDSVICPNHPESDPVTGAVHSCGHNAQSAALLGIAAALTEPGMLDGLSGKIKLCAVPAEELLEIEYRTELRKKGTIKYFGGKSEYLYRGYFDDVDIAFMVHTSGAFKARLGSVGCIAKNIIYKGRASHAGGSPWAGINAFYAATCGVNAANAVRETFKDSDLIRFHPIMTHGGSMVNAIPEEARVESYIRGLTFEAMAAANKKVNRALIGGALSLGANVEIVDSPGYSPMRNSIDMLKVAKEAYETLFPSKEFVIEETYGTGSTDMGDLSCIMPAIHPYCAGSEGSSHGMNYYIVDPVAACVDNAKWQLTIASMLLEDGAAAAKKIIEEYDAPFESAKAFLAYQDSIASSGDRITYTEDGAEIKL